MLKTPTMQREVSRRSKGQRDPERTRTNLIHAAAGEIYRSGFQGVGLDKILAKANVTKGALYHYFDSKEALGYAIIDEVIMEINEQKWLRPLAEGHNPIDTLIEIVQGTSLLPEHVEGGCPLNNLAQEMSAIDEGLRTRVAMVFRTWKGGIEAALRGGQARGQVRKDLDASDTATFILAVYEGYISLAKNAQDPGLLQNGIRMMTQHLETLRAI